jgi:hypothetical protein
VIQYSYTMFEDAVNGGVLVIEPVAVADEPLKAA